MSNAWKHWSNFFFFLHKKTRFVFLLQINKVRSQTGFIKPDRRCKNIQTEDRLSSFVFEHSNKILEVDVIVRRLTDMKTDVNRVFPTWERVSRDALSLAGEPSVRSFRWKIPHHINRLKYVLRRNIKAAAQLADVVLMMNGFSAASIRGHKVFVTSVNEADFGSELTGKFSSSRLYFGVSGHRFCPLERRTGRINMWGTVKRRNQTGWKQTDTFTSM